MSASRNIKIEYRNVNEDGIQDFPIFFYTHWDAEKLPQVIKDALIRGQDKWDDESYLARIIFSEMIKDNVLDLTGYGIDIQEGQKDLPTITVNLSTQQVDGVPYEKYITQK